MNPFATITALAERAVHLISLKNGWEVDLKTKNGRLDLFGEPKHSFPLTPDMIEASKAIKSSPTGGVRFTEIMTGYIYIGADIEDFVVAENVAKGAASLARLYLSVDVYSAKNRMLIGNPFLDFSDVPISDQAQRPCISCYGYLFLWCAF